MVLHRRCAGKLKTFVSRDELKECLTTCGAALTETLAEGVDYEKTFPLAGIDGPQRVELGAHPHVDAGQADQMRQSVGVPGTQADRGIRKVRRGLPPRREKPAAKARPLFHVRRFADDEVIFVVTQDSVLPHEG